MILENLVKQIDGVLNAANETGDWKKTQNDLLRVISPFIDNGIGTSNINDHLADQKEQRQREVNVRRTLEAKVAKLEEMLAAERGKESGGGGVHVDRNMFLIEQLNELRKDNVETKKKVLKLEIANQNLEMKKKSTENRMLRKQFRQSNPTYMANGGGGGGGGGSFGSGGSGRKPSMARTMSAGDAMTQMKGGGGGTHPATSGLPHV